MHRHATVWEVTQPHFTSENGMAVERFTADGSLGISLSELTSSEQTNKQTNTPKAPSAIALSQRPICAAGSPSCPHPENFLNTQLDVGTFMPGRFPLL